MKLKNLLGTAALAVLFASNAMAAASNAPNPGTCIAADDHHGRCTIASSSCAAGYVPNPGTPPGCNCVCQRLGAKASKTPPKSEAPAKPKS